AYIKRNSMHNILAVASAIMLSNGFVPFCRLSRRARFAAVCRKQLDPAKNGLIKDINFAILDIVNFISGSLCRNMACMNGKPAIPEGCRFTHNNRIGFYTFSGGVDIDGLQEGIFKIAW